MRKGKLNSMVRGWFVGDFIPTMYKTTDVEIAVKKYKAKDYENWHYHKIATEITAIITGEVKMNKQKFVAGDIILIEPGEGTDFLALTDVNSIVVKIPGAKNDKYLKGE